MIEEKTKEQIKEESKLGRIDIDLQTTSGPFKILMKHWQPTVNVLVGQNGTGKTMLLTCSYLVQKIKIYYKELLLIGGSDIDNKLLTYANNLATNLINPGSNWTGIILIEDVNQELFEFQLWFKNSEVKFIRTTIKEPRIFSSMGILPIVYASKVDYKNYLKFIKMKKMISLDKYIEEIIRKDDQNDLEKLTDISSFFKINDSLIFDQLIDFIAWMEILPLEAQVKIFDFQARFKNMIEGSDGTTGKLHLAFQYGDEPLKNFIVYKDSKMFLSCTKDNILFLMPLENFSSGEQQMFMKYLIPTCTHQFKEYSKADSIFGPYAGELIQKCSNIARAKLIV